MWWATDAASFFNPALYDIPTPYVTAPGCTPATIPLTLYHIYIYMYIPTFAPLQLTMLALLSVSSVISLLA